MAQPTIDLKLTQTVSTSKYLEFFDISIGSNGDFEIETGFNTAIIMSVFCERRAQPYEVSTPRYRRGWWGNTTRTDGHEDGSRLWLLEQSRLTTGTLRLAEKYTEEALQWLTEDVDLKSFQVSADAVLVNNEPSVRLSINLLRKNNASESLYFTVWSNTK